MNNAFLFDCAVKLCCSDHVSGFISAKPVIDTREKLTEQRLNYVYQLVHKVKEKILSETQSETEEKFIYCFKKAIELTCSDISCGVIAVEPILYDRNDKICETIEFYFNLTLAMTSSLQVSPALPANIQNSSINNSSDSKSASGYKTIVVPVYQKMKKAKLKKGKR
ncbi:hypothetical protein [Enterobacter sp.]|uniref:hypothetical protein n=1 Tax=Enterobacter sp. TaxID=42895 RepID=UPI00296FE093|nr:hypothetical protein [Enterobacter sp.]